MLLSHADRQPVRPARWSRGAGPPLDVGHGSVLVDGMVSAVWRLEPDGLVVSHASGLPKRLLASIAAEGRKLVPVPRSGGAGRAPRRAQPVRPAPLRVSASAPRSEAKTSASVTSIPLASAKVRPAAKQSPAP